MRLRRVTVWKHDQFTIIPRKRWLNFGNWQTRNKMQPLTNVSILSMESVDQVGRRERFMQSNFESLSGGDEGSLSTTNNSISNAWREGGSSAHQRNAGTIGEIIVNISIYHQYSQYSQHSQYIIIIANIVNAVTINNFTTVSSQLRISFRCRSPPERRWAEQEERGAAEEDRGDKDQTAERKSLHSDMQHCMEQQILLFPVSPPTMMSRMSHLYLTTPVGPWSSSWIRNVQVAFPNDLLILWDTNPGLIAPKWKWNI